MHKIDPGSHRVIRSKVPLHNTRFPKMIWIAVALIIPVLAWLLRPKWLRVARQVEAARQAFGRKDWLGAERLGRAALNSAGQLSEPARSRLLCPCLVLLAHVSYRQVKLQDADQLLQRAFAARQPDDQFESNSIAEAHQLLGQIRIDEGRYLEAQQSFERAVHWFESAGNKGMVIFELQNLGDALLLQSQFEQAEKVLLRASEVEREVIHQQLQRQGKIPGASTSISMTQPDIYFSQKRWPDALIAYQQKVRHWLNNPDVPDLVNLPRLQMRLAAVQSNLQDFPASVQTYRNCMERLTTDGTNVHPKAAVCLGRLAGALAATGNFSESKETAGKSLKMFAACALADHPEAKACRDLVAA